MSGFVVWTNRHAPERRRSDEEKKNDGLIVALVVVGAGTGLVLPVAAEDVPPPIAVELLTPRSVFTDQVSLQFRFQMEGDPTRVINADPSRTVVARITVQPGAHFPWHTHPGPVIVNVTEGELVYV